MATGDFEGFFEDFALHRLLAPQPLQLLHRALGRRALRVHHGYRVVVLADAVCSGADETHDASLEVLGERLSVQVENCRTEEFLSSL